jgi:transcriptional regulator with XRE-family HTH domain
MGENFRKTLAEQMKNQEFKKEWEMTEPQYQIIKAMIQGRKEKNLTQKQLSKITGISQGDISKIESGNANPSIKTLQRVATALGMQLNLSFKPRKKIKKREKISV